MVQGTKSTDPTLVNIAEETGKSWAQVLIRWSLQRGWVKSSDPGANDRFIPLPKSDTKERIVANIDLYDFELSDEQMKSLNALDKDEHVCINVTDCP
jgi:diketogulonate reductase-like aldo/keto reductase